MARLPRSFKKRLLALNAAEKSREWARFMAIGLSVAYAPNLTKEQRVTLLDLCDQILTILESK